jgi:phosphoglycolate phosphatase-like HAD superfamily hydrolase
MKRFELGDCFQLVLTRNEVTKMKPHPDGVHKALEVLQVRPEETVFVGDGVIDMMAAVKAGVHPIGVVSGAKGEKELRAAGATHVIHSIKFLPALLSRFPGNVGQRTKRTRT